MSEVAEFTVCVAIAAFAIWLMVRIINRRERWAKRALAVIVALPVLYAASFGPACWLVSRHDAWRAGFRDAYLPLGRIANRWQPAFDGLRWYGSVGMPKNGSLTWLIDRNETFSASAVIFAR